jgi:dTDP-4-amino-4,6-dideoxygalactose transaminase
MGHIPFNKPVRIGPETHRIAEALAGTTCGAGPFGRRCEDLLRDLLGCPTLLVTSATHALEMAALLLGVGAGDEVVIPAFTLSSTANPFLLRGAKPVFADVDPSGNLDPAEAARLISPRTRVVVPVHYGGNSCDLDELRAAVGAVPIVEDAAQAIGASFRGKALGTFGACAAISFHETKNIGCGEGGGLVLSDSSLVERAEILRDKGTDRRRFERGVVDRYTWADIGSSYTLSELNAAWLSAQLEEFRRIQSRRQQIWDRYLGALETPVQRVGASVVRGRSDGAGNAHLFAIVFRSGEQRSHYIAHMEAKQIACRFHFVALHTSPMGRKLHDGRALPGCERLSKCLVRLPLYFEMTDAEADRVIDATIEFLRTL